MLPPSFTLYGLNQKILSTPVYLLHGFQSCNKTLKIFNLYFQEFKDKATDYKIYSFRGVGHSCTAAYVFDRDGKSLTKGPNIALDQSNYDYVKL